MYKIIALFGKAGAGKDALLSGLFEEYKDVLNLNKIISCTTRPPRDYEKDGIDYHFMTDMEFYKKVANGDMLEATHFREWFYGTSASSLDKDKINIGVFNPEGILNLTETAQTNTEVQIIPILIHANDKIRIKRQLDREINPDCMEICRRFQTDEKDFIKYYDEMAERGLSGAEKIVNNNFKPIDRQIKELAKIIKDIK